jgi:2,4-dienoyl-CoA reductase-like NADH-dependent reductase (Old Yellow Enzyme family)
MGSHLIHQSSQNTYNMHTDRWSGSAETRAKFGLSLTRPVVEIIEANKVRFRAWHLSRSRNMRMEACQRFSNVKTIAQSINSSVGMWDKKILVLAGGYKLDPTRETIDPARPVETMYLYLAAYTCEMLVWSF